MKRKLLVTFFLSFIALNTTSLDDDSGDQIHFIAVPYSEGLLFALCCKNRFDRQKNVWYLKPT